MSLFRIKKSRIAEPAIITLNEPIKATGLVVRTSMKSIFTDVSRILKTYMNYKEKYGIPNQKEPWEYVSLSRNFGEDKSWDYYTGHVVTDSGNVPDVFTCFEIPTGMYAIFPVRPRKKLLLGMAIGKTKRYIYEQWIPKSKYDFTGYEFEYNDEKMFKRNPNYIDLYVALKEKS